MKRTEPSYVPLQFLQQSLHQPCSCVAECLEMCSWHWTISSVKCVPGCNPLYPTSIVYCQHSQIFSCAGYSRHTVLSLQLISSLLLKRVVVFWGHVLWAQLQGIQPGRRKCLRHVPQCFFLCRRCVFFSCMVLQRKRLCNTMSLEGMGVGYEACLFWQ